MPRDEELLGIKQSAEPDLEDIADADALEDMADDMDLLRESAQGAPVEPPVMPRDPQVMPPTPKAPAAAAVVAAGPQSAIVSQWVKVPNEEKPRMFVRLMVDGKFQGQWHAPSPQEFTWVKEHGQMVKGGFAPVSGPAEDAVPAAPTAKPLWKRPTVVLGGLALAVAAWQAYEHWDDITGWLGVGDEPWPEEFEPEDDDELEGAEA